MSKQITDYQKTKEEKPVVIPAAISYAPPAPKIPAQPIPAAAPKPQPKTAEQKPEQNPISKETQILLDGLKQIEGAVNQMVRAGDEIAGVLFGMQQKILQIYGPIDYKHISYAFPPDIANQLNFIEKDGFWIIKPKSWLNEFSEVSNIVRELGGEYVPDPLKKDSHFRVKRS